MTTLQNKLRGYSSTLLVAGPLMDAAADRIDADEALLREALEVLSDEKYVSRYSQVVDCIYALSTRLGGIEP